MRIRDIEAPFRLPAGRSLREKRRRERRTIPRGARPSSEHALRLRYSILIKILHE